jgi:hypothetical protein
MRMQPMPHKKRYVCGFTQGRYFWPTNGIALITEMPAQRFAVSRRALQRSAAAACWQSIGEPTAIGTVPHFLGLSCRTVVACQLRRI